MLGAKEIEQVIPHRGHMRLVDEIREYNENSGVGIHYVRDDEFWCAGHFPGKPIMPGGTSPQWKRLSFPTWYCRAMFWSCMWNWLCPKCACLNSMVLPWLAVKK